ncbi:MAG: beta-propeller fold lactonase family protein, partial [Planctomycetota bacterium]
MNSRFLSVVLTVCFAAPAAFAQHSTVSAVAVNPANSDEVWVCNRDNDSISVIDVSTQTLLAEIPVGVKPRSLAFTADGSKLYVVNQRGTIPEGVNFVVGQFDASQLRGSLSIVDPVNRVVSSTLSDVGVEPYGVSMAPNGAYAVVSGFRSATMTFIDTATDAKVLTHDYPRSLNFINGGMNRDMVDENFDGVADLDNPRGFSILSDSSTIWVTHFKSPYVSVLDVTLDGNGLPTGVALDSKINTDLYALDPILNPVHVRELKSQGKPRYLEDIAISPDGSRALVPHVLHNVNHDVNFDFTTLWADFPGDFANRVYPALTMLDAAQKSFDPVAGTDASNRLHNELLDARTPAATLPYGPTRSRASGAILTLG